MQTAPTKTKKATTAARVVKAVKQVIVRYLWDKDKGKETHWATVKSFEERNKIEKKFDSLILENVTFVFDGSSVIAKGTGCRVAAKGTPSKKKDLPDENEWIYIHATPIGEMVETMTYRELSGCELLKFDGPIALAFNPTYA